MGDSPDVNRYGEGDHRADDREDRLRLALRRGRRAGSPDVNESDRAGEDAEECCCDVPKGSDASEAERVIHEAKRKHSSETNEHDDLSALARDGAVDSNKFRISGHHPLD